MVITLRMAGLIYLGLIVGFIYLPVIMLGLYSFQDGTLPLPPFKGFSLRWYDELFQDRRLMESMVNSCVVAATSGIISTGLAFVAAYGLARNRYKFAPALYILFIAPITVSYLVIGLGLMMIFREIGIERSLTAVVLGHVVITFPICFAVYVSQISPKLLRLEMAARDLGARTGQVLLRVTLPNLIPATVLALALALTFSWDEFVISFLLTKFDVTLPVEIWQLLRRGLSPKANAVGTLVLFISAFIAVFAEIFIGRMKFGKEAAQ